MDERGGCHASCRQAFWVDLAAFEQGVEDETQRSCRALAEIDEDVLEQGNKVKAIQRNLTNKIAFSKAIESQLNKRITKMVKKRINMFNKAMLELDRLNDQLSQVERECEFTTDRIEHLEYRVFTTTSTTTRTATSTTSTSTTRTTTPKRR